MFPTQQQGGQVSPAQLMGFVKPMPRPKVMGTGAPPVGLPLPPGVHPPMLPPMAPPGRLRDPIRTNGIAVRGSRVPKKL